MSTSSADWWDTALLWLYHVPREVNITLVWLYHVPRENLALIRKDNQDKTWSSTIPLTMEWLLLPDWLVWETQNLLISWDLYLLQQSEFTEKDAKNKKHPVSDRPEGWKTLFRSEGSNVNCRHTQRIASDSLLNPLL